MSDLKPCPFCGSTEKAGLVRAQKNGPKINMYWECVCDECDFCYTADDTKDSAVGRWNTRADVWQPIETAPELEDVLVFAGGERLVAYFGDGSVKHPREWINTGTKWLIRPQPTHWRHLPAAPK